MTDFCYNLRANVIGVRLGRPFRLEEMRDSLDYLQLRHTKLQYHVKRLVGGTGLYAKLSSGLPLEIEERVEDQAEEQLQHTIEDMLSRPMLEHMMRVKVIFGAESCDVVIATSISAADVTSTGMIANDLLSRYAELVNDPANVSTTAEIAPVWSELSKIFPKKMSPGFMSFRSLLIALSYSKEMLVATPKQSKLRLPSPGPAPPTFFTLELSSELSETLEKNAMKANVDILSAFAAATSLGAKRKLFNLEAVASDAAEANNGEVSEIEKRSPSGPIANDADITIDMNITHDMRVSCFQPPIPNNTMSVAEMDSYVAVPSGAVATDRDVWSVAKDIYAHSAKVISSNELMAAYYYSVTASSALTYELDSLPRPSFAFQDAKDLSIDYETINKLKIDDIRFAESAKQRACKLILSKFNRKLQLSYNYPAGLLNPNEAEAIADAAIDLLRVPPSL